jgi:type IV secretory pathway VirB10-like protein
MSGPNPPGPDEPAEDKTNTGETEIYSRAYSAPESEQFTSAPYVAPDPALYDYDAYEPGTALTDQEQPPRWPWVVGVVAIVAAVALVISVTVLVARTDSSNLATPSTSTSTSAPPVQDEITTTSTTTPPPPPPPPTEELPPPPPETITVTQEPPPPPPPPATDAPPPVAAPPATTSVQAGPRFVTYSVTGTKAPLDRISVTYTDASGRQRTQQNVYIPWSLTVTPISMSEYGSVQASSLLRLSKLNCSITTSDGQTIASQNNNDWQTAC